MMKLMMKNKKLFYGILIAIGLTIFGTGLLMLNRLSKRYTSDDLPSSAVTVMIIDAITKQPVEKASITLAEVVNCPAAEGIVCPQGLFWKRESDKNGQVFFDDITLKEYIEKNLVEKDSYLYFGVTASAEDYNPETRGLIYSYTQPPEGVYYPNDKNTFYSFQTKTFVIELIGGSVSIQTRDEAIEYAKKDSRLMSWLSSHREIEPSHPEVVFEAPYWTITYTDKFCMYSQVTKCSIRFKLDARDGKIVEVSNAIGENCYVDSDCMLPPEPYEISSYGPYNAKCINNRCKVIVNLLTKCNIDSECDCSSYNPPNLPKEYDACSCINQSCTVIVE